MIPSLPLLRLAADGASLAERGCPQEPRPGFLAKAPTVGVWFLSSVCLSLLFTTLSHRLGDMYGRVTE